MRKRCSIHYYTYEHVSQEAIKYIIDAARWVPSAGNAQPTRFIIVDDEHIKEKIWESTKDLENVSSQNFIKKAPINIVVVTDKMAYKGKQHNFDLIFS